uniref:Acetyltransferase n=1 Tax=Oryza punctata TaxID=4537 RepID=A0A0E0L6Q7_ORYPU
MAAVRVVWRRSVKAAAPRPRERIPLTSWDVSMLSANYIQKGLLFPPAPSSTAHLLDHLAAALSTALHVYYPVAGRLLTHNHPHGGCSVSIDCDGQGVHILHAVADGVSVADALHVYYPVAGRFVTDKHPGEHGGCSVSIDCDGQGVHILHAVADGVSVADLLPPDAHIPPLLHSFFPLGDAVNYDGHHLPLLVVQVTELVDGVFLGFVYNHALSDGTAFWDFLNAWAEIARSSLAAPTSPPPLLKRWSPGGDGAPVVLPYADLSQLIERPQPPPLRERMLHFSSESLVALKERARQELLAAGDTAGAGALTRFQALSSLLWRCITRARRLPQEQETVCRAAINNRGRLQPALPKEYFGNSIYAISTEAVRASELVERGHGWAAAAVGRAVAAHTDADIRARVEAWKVKPIIYTLRYFDPSGVMMGSSPRFDMYGCDFGWGKPVAVRSGKANKFDGKVSLYPGREGGGSMDAEMVLTPDHMAALDDDDEFWAAVTPDHTLPLMVNNNKA